MRITLDVVAREECEEIVVRDDDDFLDVVTDFLDDEELDRISIPCRSLRRSNCDACVLRPRCTRCGSVFLALETPRAEAVVLAFEEDDFFAMSALGNFT